MCAVLCSQLLNEKASTKNNETVIRFRPALQSLPVHETMYVCIPQEQCRCVLPLVELDHEAGLRFIKYADPVSSFDT